MAKSKILLIDDEPGLLRLMTLMLSARGRYEVRSVSDSTQALTTALEFQPHLVVLDWSMPVLSGGDVAKLIRSDPRISNTPILVLSAVILRRDKSDELAGFPAVAKPVAVHELVEAIEEQLLQAA